MSFLLGWLTISKLAYPEGERTNSTSLSNPKIKTLPNSENLLPNSENTELSEYG